jgi:vacuolar-type H+-ATPase subunit H
MIVKKWLDRKFHDAKDSILNAANSAKDKVIDAAESAKETIVDAGNAAKDKAHDVVESAKEKIQNVKDSAHDAAQTVKDVGKSTLCTVSNMAGCKDYVEDPTLNQRLNEYFRHIKEGGKHYADDLSDWLHQKMDNLKHMSERDESLQRRTN